MSAAEATPAPATCPACGAATEPDARFCESCGASLGAPAPAAPGEAAAVPAEAKVADPDSDATSLEQPGDIRACRACGGTVAADGYCEQCGLAAVPERDHWAERPAADVGGVCDRGVRHARNEDAMALGVVGSFAALVVCDGVSSARDSDVASLAAATAARDLLLTGAPGGEAPVGAVEAARPAAWADLLERSAAVADEAIRAAAPDAAERQDPPSCTFVAAVLDGPLLVVGWLGDSRAYWLPDEGPAQQLTQDDSWASELVAQGMSRAEAEASRQAHAITRWLGPDAVDTEPRTVATRTRGAGWVLVCSDGLWNYCSAPEDVAALVRAGAQTAGTEPDALAAELVRWANAQGGKDNVTAVLARVGPGTAFDSLQSSAPAAATSA